MAYDTSFYGPDFLQGSVTSKLFGMDPAAAAYRDNLYSQYVAGLPSGSAPFPVGDSGSSKAGSQPAPANVPPVGNPTPPAGVPPQPGPTISGTPTVPAPSGGGPKVAGGPGQFVGTQGTLHVFEGDAPWTSGFTDQYVLGQLKNILQSDFDKYSPVQQARIADLIKTFRPDLRLTAPIPDYQRDPNPVFGEAFTKGVQGSDVNLNFNPIARDNPLPPIFPPTTPPPGSNPIARPSAPAPATTPNTPTTPPPASGAGPNNPASRPKVGSSSMAAMSIPSGWGVVEYPFPSSSNAWSVTVR